MHVDWFKELDAAVTVCDADGKILYMNSGSIKSFENDGGSDLIGKNLFDCHPGDSADKLKNLLEKKVNNCYTIEKKGIKKMILQTPWFQNSEYKGFIEISFPIPEVMPHFLRE